MKPIEENSSQSEPFYTEQDVYKNDVIQGLPVAIYKCDSKGTIQAYNKAAVELWGYEPKIGIDLWCESLNFFKTDGTPLPLAESPMSISLKEGRIINQEIIIERPDEEKRNIIPHPQLIYDNAGKIIGAVNTLIDITEQVKTREKIEDFETRARMALDAAELGTFDWDLVNLNLVNSPRLLAIFGFANQSNITHQNLIDTFHPDDKEIRDKALADSYLYGSLLYEARSIWKDGSIHWVRVNGKIVHDDNKKLLRMYGTVMDITEQKTTEEIIKQSEERFRQIADLMPQMVWTMRPDGYMDYFNKQWYEYTGVEEGSGDENKYILTHPDDELASREAFAYSLKTGEPFQIEFRVKDRKNSNSYRWVLARAVPVRDKEKKIIRWLGTSTDIDDQKNFIEKLERKVKERTTELNERSLFVQTLLDSSIESIMVIDKNERVISLNETANKLFAPYFPQGILGKSLEEIDPNTKSKPDWAYTSAALKGEYIYRKDIKSEKEDRYFDIYYIPLKKVNVFYGTMLTIREVTESVLGRIALEKANSQLLEAQQLAKIGSWEWNIADNKITWTDELYRIYGQIPGKFENNYENYLNIIHPEDREFVSQTVQNALHTHKPYDLIHRLVWPDGTVRTVAAKGKVFLDDKNTPVRLSVTSQDITETVEIKSQLRQSEMRHHLMIEQVEDYAIIFLNPQGNIEDWNKGAEKIKGYSTDEILGQNFSVFYTKEDQANGVPITMLQKAKNSKKAVSEGWRVRKDGSKFWASVFITALIDENQTLIGFAKLTRDLSEQKIIEEEIEMHTQQVVIQNNELEKINKELAAFSYIASHDLQEPLRKIVTFSTRLQDKHRSELSEDVKRYLDKIESSSLRMTKLIQDLLHYSRLTNLEKLFEQTDLNSIIKNVLDDFELLIEQKQAKIKIADLPTIEAIPLQMSQLFYNLISNALKFSRENVPPLITITSHKLSVKEIEKHPELTIHKAPKGYYEIIFKDNGVGFEQKYGEQIFIIFQRLYGKSEYTGTGIGLTISRKMVESHHGKIFCEAKENEGASFHVILPISQG